MANVKNQISDAEFEAQLLAGSAPSENSDGSKQLMVDMLHKRFSADDLVKIKNFTNSKTGWVYSDHKTLKIEQPNEFTRRVTQGVQKTRILNPGQTVIVPGWEAYVGLVRFYKQWIQTSNDGDMKVLMNSPMSQSEFLDKAFVGIYDPNETQEVEEDVKEEVEKDLGLTNVKAKA